MNITEHKGDFLIFASLARGTGVPLTSEEENTLTMCEISPGIYRRWVGSPYNSRSDISRDGYVGVLFKILAQDGPTRNKRLDDIIKACIRTKCKVGERGDSAYTNIWPLFPLFLAARYGKWIPTIPTIAIPQMRTGFRAHLLALFILVEHMIGKRSFFHRWSIEKLWLANPENPWFMAMMYLINDEMIMPPTVADIMRIAEELQDNELADTGWGSCPNEVIKGLTKFTLGLCK